MGFAGLHNPIGSLTHKLIGQKIDDVTALCVGLEGEEVNDWMICTDDVTDWGYVIKNDVTDRLALIMLHMN